MKRAVLVLALVLAASACKEEKPIVIKFEPNDLSAKPAVAVVSDAGPAASPSPSPSVSPSPSASPSARPRAKAACRTAADCVVVPAECCDCAHGGTQIAIARSQLAAEQAESKKKCGQMICTQAFSTDPSCGKHADCVDRSCVLK